LQADEQVVSKGLEDNAVERTALRNKPGQVRNITSQCDAVCVSSDLICNHVSCWLWNRRNVCV